MITIIIGIPGAGKTSLLSYKLVERMCDYGLDDYLSLKRELVKLKQGGFPNLDLPPQKHLCFADYPVRVNNRLKVYYVDGFQLALDNPYFETQFIPPYSTIFLDEAQKYYDSRMSRYIREEVYRWYQLHRHNDYNVFMACQRLGNIDLNIRSISERFWVVDKIDVKENEYGITEKITWTLREFFSCDTAENYMLAKEKNENKDIGKELIVETDLSIFDYYDSKGCRPAFYAGKYTKGFDYYTEDGYQFTLDSYVEFNNKHYFVAPHGYYKNAENDKKILQSLGVA